MGESRNVYVELEDRVLLRTEDVYQNPVGEDVSSYSDTLLSIVANFKNSGRPEGFNAQSMVGKSKRGEVACRLFAVINPETGVIEKAGFKSRGCLAITACASVVCTLLEGRTLEEALAISIEDVRQAVDGVPAGNANTLYFSTEAVRALVGDFLVRQGATLAEVDAFTGCDDNSVACMMCEHCSLRSLRTEMRVAELEEAAAARRAEKAEAANGEKSSGAAAVAAGDADAADDVVSVVGTDAAGDAVAVAAAGGAADGAALHRQGVEPEDLAVVSEAEVALQEDGESALLAVDGTAEAAEGGEDLPPRPETAHDAIALALEAVRGASRASRLTTPELWAELNLVPEAMTLEDLEMAVYDAIVAWQGQHSEEAPSSQAAALDATGSTPAEAGKNRAARRSPFGSQRAVGAPTLFSKKPKAAPAQASEGAEADGVRPADSAAAADRLSGVDQTPADEAHGAVPAFSANKAAPAAVVAKVEVQHDAPSASQPERPDRREADEEARVAAALAALDDFVEEPDEDPLDSDNPFPTLTMPEGRRLVRRHGSYQWEDVPESADDGVDGVSGPGEISAEGAAEKMPEADGEDAEELPIRCENIALLMGRSGYYLYDRTVMTDAYAHWSFLAAEADPLVTFADCVREDSRVYPRPYARKNLANDPFYMDADAVEAAFAEAQANPDYADIQRLEASNGDVYFFSTRYLKEGYAQSLAEWASVERFRNV